MPNRPKICNKHKNHVASCEDCDFAERRNERLRRSNETAAKVEAETEFLRSLPEDEAARSKIIKTRAAERSANRAAAKLYRGPPLKTKEDEEAEIDRLEALNKQFKAEAARWTEVQKEAKIADLKQIIPIREAELENLVMKEEVIRTENNEIKLATEQKIAEIKRLKELKATIQEFNQNLELSKTGNGNLWAGPGNPGPSKRGFSIPSTNWKPPSK